MLRKRPSFDFCVFIRLNSLRTSCVRGKATRSSYAWQSHMGHVLKCIVGLLVKHRCTAFCLAQLAATFNRNFISPFRDGRIQCTLRKWRENMGDGIRWKDEMPSARLTVNRTAWKPHLTCRTKSVTRPGFKRNQSAFPMVEQCQNMSKHAKTKEKRYWM